MAAPVLGIMTQAPSAYPNLRIVEACERAGLKARMLDPEAFDIVVGQTGPATCYHGEVLEPPAAFYARTGAWTTAFGLAVVAQMEATPGVAVLNSAESVAAARDKLRGQQRLSAAGLPVPATALLRDPADAAEMARRLGGLPLVVKVLAGTKGEGVALARTSEELDAALAEALHKGDTLLLQDFVEESEGRDLRVLVVGGRVLGAMSREAPPGEFRANVAKGARVSGYPLDDVLSSLALRAARAMGLDIAGVDLLFSADGYLIVEVNSAPGFEGFERATGVRVAEEIVRLAADRMAAEVAR